MDRNPVWNFVRIARSARAPSSFSWRGHYALCGRNIEFIFLVTDEQTGEPVTGAQIDIRIEDFDDKGPLVGAKKLTTDNSGMAKMLRENQMCEDVIRPFRKTITLVNRTWCVFSIGADGYRSIENAWLAEFRYKDKGFFPEEGCQRVEFKFALQKK